VHRELQNNMFGQFNPDAKRYADAMIQATLSANERYDAAMRKADSLQDFAISAEKQMLQQAMQPPKNSHEAWNLWGSAAGLLALVGGIAGGRHFTAALGAAGTMMQSAENADRGAYDKAYQQWKDQRDFGMRATELLVREANEAVSRAGSNYNHQMAALQSPSTAYQLPRQLDHDMLADITQRLGLEKAMADLHKAQNADTEERLAVDERDQEWSRQNDGRQVPAGVHNQNVGLVQAERKGVGAGKTETKEISQVAPDGSARTGAAYRIGTNWFWAGTGEPVEGQFDFKSTARPRSAPAEYIDQLKKENPNISASEISHANALFRADSAFAAGPEGRSVNSLNTLADHLPLFEKYASALETGDVRLVNRALQALSEETGHPDITNYELASESLRTRRSR